MKILNKHDVCEYCGSKEARTAVIDGLGEHIVCNDCIQKNENGIALTMAEQQRKCVDCRECCEYIEYPVTMLSVEVIEYFILRGEQIYIDPSNGVLMARIHKPCQHLTENGCGIYETRPEACRMYICHHKDKSVYKAKEQMCAQSMVLIQQGLKQFKENRK